MQLAHSGNTDANGCHVCRTNCDLYGIEWNVPHCHNTKLSLETHTSVSKKDVYVPNKEDLYNKNIAVSIAIIVIIIVLFYKSIRLR